MRAKRGLISDFRLTSEQICVDLHIASHPLGSLCSLCLLVERLDDDN
jgi:hypothetical protein